MFECLIKPTITLSIAYSQDEIRHVPGCKAKDDIYQFF